MTSFEIDFPSHGCGSDHTLVLSNPVVLKVFFTFLPYKPKHCQFLPNKDHK